MDLILIVCAIINIMCVGISAARDNIIGVLFNLAVLAMNLFFIFTIIQ